MRWVERAREVIAPESAALDLAVLRISVAIVLGASGSVAVADHWAALPPATRVAPLGVGWLVAALPISPAIVGAVRAIFWGACVLGGIGLATRASWIVIAIAASYLLLVPQLGGAVFHDHHLLWLAVLLASSPCGDALSVDAWLARRRGAPRPTHGRAHGATIRAAWILIGLVFLFPGAHKLAESGWAWVASDNLRNQMWWKWAQDPSTQPALRIDRHPIVLRVLAALTIVFELSFLPLVLARPTRAIAVLGALAFHAGTEIFMGIRFSTLWALYGMFAPWERMVQRVRPSWLAPRTEGARSIVPVALAAAVLVGGATGAGALGAMHAYPFACYPTFQWIPRDRMPALAIDVEHADGAIEHLDPALYREPGPRGWALEWSLAGVYGPIDRARIEAWWRDRAAREPLRAHAADARAIRFHRVAISVDPDRRGDELERREILTLIP